MTHNKTLRDKAFQLYASGIPKERVAKEIGISKLTLYRWIKKYAWTPRKKMIEAKVDRLQDENVIELKERQLKIARLIIQGCIKSYNDDKMDFKPKDLLDFLKHELHLRGEAEMSITNPAQEALVAKMELWFGKGEEKKKDGDDELDEEEQDI